jgi:hypothetical protein
MDADELIETAMKCLDGVRTDAADTSDTDSDFGDPDWHRRFVALVRAVDAMGMHVVG